MAATPGQLPYSEGSVQVYPSLLSPARGRVVAGDAKKLELPIPCRRQPQRTRSKATLRKPPSSSSCSSRARATSVDGGLLRRKTADATPTRRSLVQSLATAALQLCSPSILQVRDTTPWSACSRQKSSHSTVSAQAQAASPTQWQEEHPRRRKYANRFIEFSLELEQGSSPLSAERLCKLRYRNRDQ
eukprot:TRINITY_DN2867_c0_g1_i4.p1 TRINITY_DN2867_c0_g1~~TRINITY_DN2867_c0_g1_i4.p1  ORF type:complete len:207 (+),score=31.85 TRINITY_DN2867_c0_g1_i4:62-622(+)